MNLFDQLPEESQKLFRSVQQECLRFHDDEIRSEHLLLGLSRCKTGPVCDALSLMNVKLQEVEKEVDKVHLSRGKTGKEAYVECEDCADLTGLGLSVSVRRILSKAQNVRRYFGREKLYPEHILLALLEVRDNTSAKIFEELGVNLNFLRRLVMQLISKEDCFRKDSKPVSKIILTGLSELNAETSESLENLKQIYINDFASVPGEKDIAYLVFMTYIPDFLLIQIPYQRYLLEETLAVVKNRVGNLDKELIAAMVSSAAQNVCAEVRKIIEYLWSNEFRSISKMPDEAEHDLIGSVIEDLWWTHSEEIALHEVFDEALDDYRRKQVLNLQKRRIETTQRLFKLQSRLRETIKQCFSRKSMSA